MVVELNGYLRVLRTDAPVGLFQPTESGRDPVTERQLRPILAELDWGKQRETAATVTQNNAGVFQGRTAWLGRAFLRQVRTVRLVCTAPTGQYNVIFR